MRAHLRNYAYVASVDTSSLEVLTLWLAEQVQHLGGQRPCDDFQLQIYPGSVHRDGQDVLDWPITFVSYTTPEELARIQDVLGQILAAREAAS